MIVTLIRSSEPARRNPLDRDRLAGIQLPPPIIMINFLGCVSATLCVIMPCCQRRTLPRFLVLSSFFSLSVTVTCRFILVASY